MITRSRLEIFIIILICIFIYKFIFDRLQNIVIKSKIGIYLNLLKNPILNFIIIFESFTFNILYVYHNKILIYIFYFIFVFCINPLKILLYKYYTLLDL